MIVSITRSACQDIRPSVSLRTAQVVKDVLLVEDQGGSSHGRGVSCEQGPDQGEALRVQNVRRPDSQATALHRTNPKSGVSLNFKPECLAQLLESQFCLRA